MNLRLIGSLSLISLSIYSWDVKEWVPNLLASPDVERTTEEVKLSQPCTLIINHQLRGNVNIKAWDKPYAAFTIEKTEDATVTIDKKNLPEKLSCIATHEGAGKKAGHAKLTIQAPFKTALQITTRKADIKTKGLEASQQLTTHNGPITVKLPKHGTNQAVFAQTEKSPILIKVCKKCNAHLHANSRKGIVTADVPVTLDMQTTKINKELWHRMKHEISGCIGTGGIPITLESHNGDIAIVPIGTGHP